MHMPGQVDRAFCEASTLYTHPTEPAPLFNIPCPKGEPHKWSSASELMYQADCKRKGRCLEISLRINFNFTNCKIFNGIIN